MLWFRCQFHIIKIMTAANFLRINTGCPFVMGPVIRFMIRRKLWIWSQLLQYYTHKTTYSISFGFYLRHGSLVATYKTWSVSGQNAIRAESLSLSLTPASLHYTYQEFVVLHQIFLTKFMTYIILGNWYVTGLISVGSYSLLWVSWVRGGVEWRRRETGPGEKGKRFTSIHHK